MNLMKYAFVAILLCLYSTMASAFEPIPGESGSGDFVFSGFATETWMPLGLTSEQMRLPGSESGLQQAEILFRFPLADRQLLIPSFMHTKDDLDWDAMNSDIYDFKLTYFYARNKFNLIASGFIGRSEYEKRNSAYNKTQEDDHYGGAVRVSYRQPFGWQPFGNETFNLWGNVAFYRSDAKIDFYEQEAIEAAMGAMIRF
jgi:hypothetical protein